MIDLLVIADRASTVVWDLGSVIGTTRSPRELAAILERWRATATADALLFWDPRMGPPPTSLSSELVAGRGDLWHAGLLLGTAAQPGLIDFVMPTWMLNRDPDPALTCTSWRTSPGVCLVRADVIRQLGGPDGTFETLSGAFLEWGLRAIQLGAISLHVPALVEGRERSSFPAPSLRDEVRIVASRYSPLWTRWAIGRAVLTGYAALPALLDAHAQLEKIGRVAQPPYRARRDAKQVRDPRVTVLIPTIDRYPYLRVALQNLRAQTVRPVEIIVVDQTERASRDTSIAHEFRDLPLEILYRDEPGQSGARNEGLARSIGDHIMFLDDDVEFGPTLIADHLSNLARYDADVSSGSVYEPGTSPPDPTMSFVHVSEVFPTGNTLVKREVLARSGLFDLAFDRAPRADGELGMRVYLSGALMVFDARITMLHHRAPSGGLRRHGARVATYRTSRTRLTERHLPHVSEVYLASRHFSPRQVREVLWLRALGTLSGRGGRVHRLAKLLVGAAMLPDTIWQTVQRKKAAASWLTRFPQIAQLAADVTVRSAR